MDYCCSQLLLFHVEFCNSSVYQLWKLSSRRCNVGSGYCESSDLSTMAVTRVELILHCIQAFGLAQVMAVFAELSSGFGTSMDLLDDSQLDEIQKAS